MNRRVIPTVLAIALAAAAAPARATEPIVTCGHVPITGAAPVPHHANRFGQFYFDHVNANGGIDGRPVEMKVFDDGYYPAGARAAVEKCSRDAPVLYFGWSGTDQLVSVAKWAQTKRVPYIHGPSSTDASTGWMLSPSFEASQVALANMIADNGGALTRAGDPVVAMVRTSSPYGDTTSDAFRRALAARGLRLRIDAEVQRDERQFAQLTLDLMRAEVNVINFHGSWNAFSAMSRYFPPTYRPAIVSGHPDLPASPAQTASVPPFRFTLLHEPAPLYDPDDDTLPWAAEIDEFLRIFATYSPEQNPPPDAFDWAMYLRAKQVHRILVAMGGDYSRSNVVATLDSYRETARDAFPACALDLTGGDRVGGDAWHVLGLETGWRQLATCAGADGPIDAGAPSLACGPAAQAATEIRCRASDALSGIASIEWRRTEPLGTSIAVSRFGCAGRASDALVVPPGAWRHEVIATDCAGNAVRADVLAVSAG